jgi:hypothetical protein
MKFNGLDKLLIVFLILCNARLYYYFVTGFNKGDWVAIEVEIENGRARIVLSPCKLKVWIKSGYIQYADSLSACLPNKVLVRIDGKAQRGLDAVVG